MREIDRVTSQRYGVPSRTLMENAGGHVAAFVLRRFPRADRIAIFCGKGNNGGDGFVAARKLHEAGKKVDVLLFGETAEVKGDAAHMLDKLAVPPTVIRRAEELDHPLGECDLVLDAILGTGFRPPVTGLIAAAIERINAADVPVFAVDIPSGANADAFSPEPHLKCRADAIVTFTAPRPAHVFADLTRGEIVVGPIGSPGEAVQSSLNLEVIAWPNIAPCFATRRPDANKGNFGHVLVIGGSLGKSGAAAMAGMAALRAGAGLSTVATPRCVLPMVAGFAAELMTEPLAETEAGTISLAAREYGRLDAIIASKTAVALGPGISRHPETVEFIHAVMDKYELPLVVDADGLNAFEGCAEKLSGAKRPLVLTPHPGEMARLTRLSTKQIQQDRIGVARQFAAEHQCIVVLKGHRTLVAEPTGRVWVNMTGNPGMASGGTGDVLTGLIAGMVAQFPDELVRAVCAAVWLHGYAGDRAAALTSEQYLTATDLLHYCWISPSLRQRLSTDPFVVLHGIVG